jgi:O-antigen/teichoic acid export membrane protein
MHEAAVSEVRDGGPESHHSDRVTAARSGALGMLGAAYAGAMGFLLTVVIGRFFGSVTAGLFFESVAIFTVLNGVALMGADTGMIRTTARLRAMGRDRDLSTLVRVTAPALILSGIASGLMLWTAARPAADWMNPEEPDQALAFLRVLAGTLVISALCQAYLHGTRAHGSIRPFVLLYQVGLPTSRVLLVVLVAMMDGGAARHHALAWAWAGPLVAMDIAAVAYIARKSRRLDLPSPHPSSPPRTDSRFVAAEMWRFSLPRGLASLFETGLVWIDVLIVGYYLGPAIAGSYAAASRFVTTGTLAMEATRLATAPILATAFAHGDRERARSVFGYTTVWLILISWPLFIALALHSHVVMASMGRGFEHAAGALQLMALMMLAYTAMGNVNALLLMAGRSNLTALNTAFSFILNVALNVALVPAMGVAGAAVAWGSALIFDSVLCTLECRYLLQVTQQVRPAAAAMVVSAVAFGLPALFARALHLPTLTGVAFYGITSLSLYGALLWWRRADLYLDGFFSHFHARRAHAFEQ